MLLDQISIERPIVFLCGPYYNKKDDGDRRKILKQTISNQYSNRILPLIIDDFLTEENIDDKTISIQLMEEICAAVSVKTYIFLDTLSSSAELGIFANSTFMNKIQVYIPKKNDIYNKSNVGYFVREISLKSRPDTIKVLEYRPGVKRNAIASDYIVEFYSFVGNKLPLNIHQSIINDEDLKESKGKTNIEIIESADMPQSHYQICYSITNQELQVNTSIKLMFYVTLAIVSCEYKELFDNKESDFSKISLEEVEQQVKDALYNLIESKTLINKNDLKKISVKTVLKQEQNDNLIRHIVKFLHVFNNNSDYGVLRLFKNPINKIIKQVIKGKTVFDVIKLTQEQIELLMKINSNPDLYYETIEIRTGNKVREIVKYRNDKNGDSARKIHEAINQSLKNEYMYSSNSYAYKKGENIKKCVINHLDGMGFLKYDIRKFFNSISIELLAKKMIIEFDIDPNYVYQLKSVLMACSYNNQIPLGFVTSPIFSDIFMKDVDNKICSVAEKNDCIYTRYADDILISSKQMIGDDMYKNIDLTVKATMLENGLVTNEKKNQFINFDSSHSFLRYIGVNIIHQQTGNIITVGKTYINDVAKDYIEYDQKKNNCQQQLNEELFYSRLRIIGKIAFIKQIEGDVGVERLKRRLYKYDPNIDFDAV
ncbi:reverse transcriptase domain-containing protein [Butyrivibrio sp. M55]|uniref:reverse transcriptase domain-containing protein n=1 Tax=Butyrivibrio sp. M55 TaxID=1855323 RepID=UPI0015873D0E|nr:reverse transcriptase domain-containing protein [Butyrivibrio sp. M55]